VPVVVKRSTMPIPWGQRKKERSLEPLRREIRPLPRSDQEEGGKTRLPHFEPAHDREPVGGDGSLGRLGAVPGNRGVAERQRRRFAIVRPFGSGVIPERTSACLGFAPTTVLDSSSWPLVSP